MSAFVGWVSGSADAEDAMDTSVGRKNLFGTSNPLMVREGRARSSVSAMYCGRITTAMISSRKYEMAQQGKSDSSLYVQGVPRNFCMPHLRKPLLPAGVWLYRFSRELRL